LHPSEIDWVIMGCILAFVLGVARAAALREDRTDYSFRSLDPAWVAGLAFCRPPGCPGSHRHGGIGRQLRHGDSHFYWVGEVPAMVFRRFHDAVLLRLTGAARCREYLKLRFDEKTRGLNAISFATMTVSSSGISMYAMGLLLNLLLGGTSTPACGCRRPSF